MLWIKALHIIAVTCWFAGLFYLPRLFVYHAMSNDRQEKASGDNFKIMERKLYYGITMPSMILTWACALVMLYVYAWQAYSSMGWLHAKLTLGVLLTAYHFSMGYFVKRFKQDLNTKSHKFFRFYNEIPVFFLITMVILVVIKPF